MKKQITFLLITLLIAFYCTSQTSSDTVTCIPNTYLKKAINLIEKGRVTEDELIQTKLLVKSNEKGLLIKDSIILKYELSVGQYKNMTESYEESLKNKQRIIYNLETQIKLNKKINRRQKASKYIVGILGLALGYLISK